MSDAVEMWEKARAAASMSLPTGRSDRRIPKEAAVELARPGASQFRETAIAQNVSARGMRIATEHVWRPHPGTSRLLSAHGKQQVCCRFRTFGPARRRNQATLARRENYPRSLYTGDTDGFGLRRVFPADILNFLRRQAYQRLLVRASPIALRASPQAKPPFL